MRQLHSSSVIPTPAAPSAPRAAARGRSPIRSARKGGCQLGAGIWLVLKLPAKYVQPYWDKAERLIEQIKVETEDVQK